MRLIDADKLLSKLNKAYAEVDAEYQEAKFDSFYGGECSAIQEIIKEVEKQPAAYDIDNVVERLKKEAEYSHADYCGYAQEYGFDEDTDYHFAGLERAVEIVKSGICSDGEHIRSDVEESAIKNHIMQRFMRKE